LDLCFGAWNRNSTIICNLASTSNAYFSSNASVWMFRLTRPVNLYNYKTYTSITAYNFQYSAFWLIFTFLRYNSKFLTKECQNEWWLSEWKEQGNEEDHGENGLMKLKRIWRYRNKKLAYSGHRPEGMEENVLETKVHKWL
jgi:hypothetical protein